MGEPVMGRRAYGPIGDIGDVVLLLSGADGPIQAAPFRQIAYYERIDFYGVHGLVAIWRDSVDIAPYMLDAGGITQHIVSQKTTTKIAPGALRFPDGNVDGMAQIRMRLRPIALTGPVPQDLDVNLFHAAGLQKWALASNSNATGAMNMRNQWPDPGDVAEAQAEGGAIAIPTEAVCRDPWEDAPEIFVVGNQGPAFTITNTGSADTTGGMLALEVSIIRYVLNPLDAAGGIPVKFLAGQADVTVPPGVDWPSVRKIAISGSSR